MGGAPRAAGYALHPGAARPPADCFPQIEPLLAVGGPAGHAQEDLRSNFIAIATNAYTAMHYKF
jgi:hypothetical protein